MVYELLAVENCTMFAMSSDGVRVRGGVRRDVPHQPPRPLHQRRLLPKHAPQVGIYSVMQSDRNSSKIDSFHEHTTYEPHV